MNREKVVHFKPRNDKVLRDELTAGFGYAAFGLYDNGAIDNAHIEQVEITKGLPAAYYTASTTGVILNQKAKMPLGYQQGTAQIAFGSYRFFRTVADYTTPIKEDLLGGRITVAHEQDEKREYLDAEHQSMQAKVDWKLTQKISIDITVSGDDAETEFAPTKAEGAGSGAAIKLREVERRMIRANVKVSPKEAFDIRFNAVYGKIEMQQRQPREEERLGNVWLRLPGDLDRRQLGGEGSHTFATQLLSEEEHTVYIGASQTHDEAQWKVAAQPIGDLSVEDSHIYGRYMVTNWDSETTVVGTIASQAVRFRENKGGRTGRLRYDSDEASGSIGISQRVLKGLRVYWRYAEGYSPNGGYRGLGGGQIDGMEMSNHEVGIKFELLDNRIAGTVPFYRSERENMVRHWNILPEWKELFARGPALALNEEDTGVDLSLYITPSSNYQILFSAWTADRDESVGVNSLLTGPAWVGGGSNDWNWRVIPEKSLRIWNAYRFDDGVLDGIIVGGGFRLEAWRVPSSASYGDIVIPGMVLADLDNYHALDLMLVKEFEAAGLDWRLQLNVDDVFGGAQESIDARLPSGETRRFKLDRQERVVRVSVGVEF